MRWLVERFRLGPLIPPCWPAHPWAVEELSALHAAWNGVYRGPGFPDGPAGWMNLLGQFIGRIRTVWSDQVCGQYQHDEPGSSWPSDPAATTVTTHLIVHDQLCREHPEPTQIGRWDQRCSVRPSWRISGGASSCRSAASLVTHARAVSGSRVK